MVVSYQIFIQCCKSNNSSNFTLDFYELNADLIFEKNTDFILTLTFV